MSIQPTATVIGLTVALFTACSSPQEANGDTATDGALAATNTQGSSTTSGSGTVGTATATVGSTSGGPTPTPTTTTTAGTTGGLNTTTGGANTATGSGGSGGEPLGGTTGTGGNATTIGGGPTTGGSGTTGPLPPVYEEENTGSDCPVATTFPAFNELQSIQEFPDPFLMESGERIASRADWRCRRAEISAQIQQWELGTKPPPTASEVTATYSGNMLTVNVQVGGQYPQSAQLGECAVSRSHPDGWLWGSDRRCGCLDELQ